MTTQSSTPKNAKGFEESIWDAANKLRGSGESSEYKHVVLSLIFLKFLYDKFVARQAELVEERKQDFLDMVEFYTMKNVLHLPEEARRSHLLQYAKQRDLAIRIDSALLDAINNIDTVADQADYIMANPPFNLKDWRADDELVHDARWNGYDTPPSGNANYAWILQISSKSRSLSKLDAVNNRKIQFHPQAA
jgi:type I restriction-modification system DNA methylase subunit